MNLTPKIGFIFIAVVAILEVTNGSPGWHRGCWIKPVENIGLHWESIEDKLIFEDFFSNDDFQSGVELTGWTELDKCNNSVKAQYIPNEFDSRLKWPDCRSLWEIRDQGRCDSWASVVASVISDRWCISNKGVQTHFSSYDLLTCGMNATGWDISEDVKGCKGGNIFKAWKYVEENNLVTGGHYGSSDGCLPYGLPPCNHTSAKLDTSIMPSCDKANFETPTCQNKCLNDGLYAVPYAEDKAVANFTKKACVLEKNNVEEIQTEIMTNGPVVASMLLCDDFFHYTTSVYRRSSTKCHKYHAVKLLGWGTEVDTDQGTTTNYWIAANTWNYYWGDGGFFKIIRGHPFLGAQIEQQVSAGFPSDC